MDQDVSLGITGSVTQADLAPLRVGARLGEFALVYRVERQHQGGGYGDQGKHPLAWAVAVYVDGQLCRVFNARGAGREWNNIDRLSSWLRDQGFWYWWTRNDLEPVGVAITETDDPGDTSNVPENIVPDFIDNANTPDISAADSSDSINAPDNIDPNSSDSVNVPDNIVRDFSDSATVQDNISQALIKPPFTS